MPKADAEAVEHLLTHNVSDVHDRAHLRARLLGKEKLRVKLGVDPTAPGLHLGHGILLRKLAEFQALGHTVVFVIGDVTGRIGDPSGRMKARPPVDDEEIAINARTYFEQVGRFLSVKRADVRTNSEWLNSLSFKSVLELLSKFTVARVLEREDFQRRLERETPIGLHELLYPVLQAYDSVAARADLEVGGTDQTFNLLVGRDLQPYFHQPPQDILTVPLLVGLDGKEKMSKSLGNAVGVTEPPDDMLGKLMTIPDAVIPDYARLAADWPDDRVKKLPRRLQKEHPRDVKLEVAQNVVELYHGNTAAERAAAEWLRVFHKKELPSNVPKKKLKRGSWNIAELLVAAGLALSKSEARRLVAQGGVQHNEVRLSGDTQTLVLKKGDLLQVGKRKFVRVS